MEGDEGRQRHTVELEAHGYERKSEEEGRGEGV